jgi:predicted PurR-regulated permease PerM
MNSEKNLEISWGTILKIGIAVVCFYILYSIGNILILALFALIISILFNPAIDFLQKKSVPRIMGTTAIYLIFFTLFGIFIYTAIVSFMGEIRQFLSSFPQYFERLSPILKALGLQTFLNSEDFLKNSQETLSKMSGSVFDALFSFFGGVFSALFVIIMAFFISLEEKMIEKTLIIIFPKKYEFLVSSIWNKCQKKVSGWFGARILSCIFVGLVTYIVLFLFKVKYPFSLALFAGVFNFVPYIGAFIAGALLFIIALPIDFLKSIFVLIAYVLTQQVDNYIVSPILLRKFIGMPPVLVLLSIVIGGKLWGFLGAVLVVPLVGIIFEFLKEFLEKKRSKEVAV